MGLDVLELEQDRLCAHAVDHAEADGAGRHLVGAAVVVYARRLVGRGPRGAGLNRFRRRGTCQDRSRRCGSRRGRRRTCARVVAIELQDMADEHKVAQRLLDAPPRQETSRIGRGHRLRGDRGPQLCLGERDRDAVGRDVSAHVLRHLALGLELEVAAAQGDGGRRGLGRDHPQVGELCTKLPALRWVVADRDDPARQGLAFDDQVRQDGQRRGAHVELEAPLDRRAADRVCHEREDLVLGRCSGRREGLVPKPIEIWRGRRWLRRRGCRWSRTAGGTGIAVWGDAVRRDARGVKPAELTETVSRAELSLCAFASSARTPSASAGKIRSDHCCQRAIARTPVRRFSSSIRWTRCSASIAARFTRVCRHAVTRSLHRALSTVAGA